jgi:DNA invertase Pin-like site-specific DNA recombinase
MLLLPLLRIILAKAGIQLAEWERPMVHVRTKAGIEKAKRVGVPLSSVLGSRDKTTPYKIDRIKIFLHVGKGYHWVYKERAVRKQTIAKVKKNLVCANFNENRCEGRVGQRQ